MTDLFNPSEVWPVAERLPLIETPPLVPADAHVKLAEHAEVIRTLGKRVVGDVIEIGRRLTDAKAMCRHGEWLPWLEREFGWSDDTALNFTRVYEMDKSRTVRDLGLSMRGLYLLARPSTPEPVRKEVIERAESGEHFTHAQVKDMIAKAVAEARPDFEAELARLKDEAEADVEAELALLRQEADRREKAVRDEFAGKLPLDPTEIQKKIHEATAPLNRRIEEAAAEIERSGKREHALREQLKIAQTPVMVPTKRYGTIVIDPPWPMKKIERDVRPNQVEFDYPTMDYEQLRAFRARFQPLAADDCHVFMWTTHKFLLTAGRLLEDYGVKYVFQMVWHKPGGMQPVGLPQYNCEFVLYGRIGTPTFVDTKAFNCCFNAPRTEHSRKPDEFYDTVRRVTAGDRIDIFSREKREGFDQYGNEVDKFGGAS